MNSSKRSDGTRSWKAAAPQALSHSLHLPASIPALTTPPPSTSIPNTRKSQVLASLLGGAVGYLESCPGVCEVKLCTRPPMTPAALHTWDAVHLTTLAHQNAASKSPLTRPLDPQDRQSSLPMQHGHSQSMRRTSQHPVCQSRILPPDLIALYSISDGLSVQWSVRFGNDVILLGCLHVNSLERLARVDTPHLGPAKVTADKISKPEEGATPRPLTPSYGQQQQPRKAGRIPTSLKGVPHPPGPAYLLQDIPNHGKVCLCCPPYPKQHSVWFQNTSGAWYCLASSFSAYFRMMVSHLGVTGWQSGMTETGMGASLDWLGFYAVERAALCRRVRAILVGSPLMRNGAGGVVNCGGDEGVLAGGAAGGGAGSNSMEKASAVAGDDDGPETGWDLEKTLASIKTALSAKRAAAAAAAAVAAGQSALANAGGTTLASSIGLERLSASQQPLSSFENGRGSPEKSGTLSSGHSLRPSTAPSRLKT
ncbi:Tubulin polyglutamylase complex subunit 2 [Irineochytrium annulatum]|nr:Tubulin polyglutamylase complex subunit 2 [Irineochytrium annulatum]